VTLQWCCNPAAVVLQPCCSGAAAVLQPLILAAQQPLLHVSTVSFFAVEDNDTLASESTCEMVEAAGIEPASASPRLQDLRA
jgi:hypothetical protein